MVIHAAKDYGVVSEVSLFDRAAKMWREIDFAVLEEEGSGLVPYLSALESLYDNGEVLHKTFLIPDHPDMVDFASRGVLHAACFFERFWRTNNVRKALPYQQLALNFFSTELFRPIHPVELPGDLACALVLGGAYSQGGLPARTAMDLAGAAAESLLGGDFEGAKVYVSRHAWSDFFRDVAWDHTWLVVQPDKLRIELVMATDAD